MRRDYPAGSHPGGASPVLRGQNKAASPHGPLFWAGVDGRLTEIIPNDQDPDTDVSKGFRLKNARYYSCSIQLDREGFILTGGFDGNSREVTEYSFREADGKPHELPPLIVGRYSHACGSYQDNARGSKVIQFYNTVLSHNFLRC